MYVCITTNQPDTKSNPSVDTDEQSTGSWPHFYQTFKMLWQIFRADNVFVRF